MSDRLPANIKPGPLAPQDDPISWGEPSPFSLRDMEDESGISMGKFFRAFKRYWWVLVLSAAAGVGSSFVAVQFAEPEYRADGSIWIAIEGPESQVTGPITQGGLLEPTAWPELLTSYEVLDSVVFQERLYLRYAAVDSLAFRGFTIDTLYRPGEYTLAVASDGRGYTLSTKDELVLEEGELGGGVGRGIGFLWTPRVGSVPADGVVSFSVVTPRDAARELALALVPDMDRQGNFLRLSLEGTNPVRIARVLNAVMERHVEVAAELKRVKLDELTLLLQEQLATAEENLRIAEQDLETYQVRTITMPREESSPIV
ncbi:MAG: hypothetical protein PVJ76_19995, partial [Gemmatimonadota bacterium]